MTPQTITTEPQPIQPVDAVDGVPTEPAPMAERAIIFITSVGHLVCHMGELVFAGATVAIMREFQLLPHLAASLALLGYVLMGVGAIPVGLWTDAWGPTRIFRIYFVVMALAAISVVFASNLWLLFLTLTALGLAASIYHPAGLSMISLGVRRRGRAMGINGVAGNIGIALGLFLGAAAAAWGSWRIAYVVVACFALVGSVLMEAALRMRLILEPERRADPLPISTPDPSATENVRGSYLPLGLLMAAMLLAGFNYRFAMTALPPYLTGETGKNAVFILAAVLVGGAGQLFGSWKADGPYVAYIYVGLVAMLGVCAFLLASVGGTILAVPVAGLMAFFMFGQQPVENTLLAEITSKGRRSVSYGIKFALTFGVGALGLWVAGRIWTDYGSVKPVFYLITGSTIVMAGLVLAFIRVSRRSVSHTEDAAHVR